MAGISKIGIYVDPGFLEIAEFTSRLGKASVLRRLSIPISPSSTDLVPSINNIIAALRKAAETVPFKAKHVTVSIAGKEVFTRYFELPQLNATERHTAVQFEIQKHIPLNINDIYQSYKVRVDRKQKKTQVMALACQKKIADPLNSFFCDDQVASFVLETTCVSLARNYNWEHPKNKLKVVGIIDLRSSGAVNFIIAQDLMVLLAREFYTLAPGGGDFKVDFETLLSELKLSLNYFFKNFRNIEIHQMVLFADTKTTFQGWEKKLEAELHVPTVIGKSFLADDPVRASLPEVAIATGAALGGFFPPVKLPFTQELNLIPKRTLQPRAESLEEAASTKIKADALTQKYVFISVAAAIISFFILHLLLGALLIPKNKLLQKITQSQSAIASAVDSSIPIESLQQKEAELSLKLAFLKKAFHERVFWTDKLSSVAHLIPKDVELQSFMGSENFKETGASSFLLRIEGRIAPREPGGELQMVNQLVNTLKNDTDFMRGISDIKIGLAKVSEGESTPIMRFVINCYTLEASQS